jgi:hypothetical protein
MGIEDLALAVKYYETLNPQAEIAKEDPYLPFASISDQVAGTLLQNPDKFSTKDIILGSLASGLVGGGLNYLSRDYQAGLTSDYMKALERAQAGAPVAYADSDLPRSLFSKANTMGSLFRTIRAQEQADLVQKAQIDYARERAGKLLDLGYEEDGKGNLVQVVDLAKLEGDKARAKKAAEIGVVTGGGTNPFQEALQKFGDDVLARDFVKTSNPEFLGAKQAVEKGGSPEQTLAFVEKQFDDAKNLHSAFALIPGTQSANEMAGIQTNLRTKIQQALGREMNGPEQEKLMAALPDWNDTAGQIEAKKRRFTDLVQNLITPSAQGGAPKAASGLPKVGGVFNNEKVLSVKKLK